MTRPHHAYKVTMMTMKGEFIRQSTLWLKMANGKITTLAS